jgi:hypothetical protein
MRENRPYGSEGGEGKTLPDPYQRNVCQPKRKTFEPAAATCCLAAAT